MNHPGLIGLPGGRGVWIGPGPCVAGAHLALSGPDLDYSGTGLVFGIDLGQTVTDGLEQAIDPGAGSVHFAGRHYLGAQVCRIPGRNTGVSMLGGPMKSGPKVQVALTPY